MRIALAQIDPTVGDLAGNADIIVRESRVAAEGGAALAVFPELSLLGYPPLDLLDEAELVESAAAARCALVERLGRDVPGLSVIFGCIGASARTGGKSLQNLAVLARDGREVAVRPKSLLPSYDVFDEDRWFTPASDTAPVEHLGRRFGLSVCEDIWNDALFWERTSYDRDPVTELVEAGAEVLVNISASPYHRGKPSQREDMLRATARRHRRPVVFVNQVGANDELIFDGGSTVLDAQGRVVARAKRFQPETLVVDLDAVLAGEAHEAPAEAILSGSAAELVAALEAGIAGYVRKCGFPGVLVGLSGGIDSAVVAVLAARALGPMRVEAVLLPSRFTASRSNEDAMELVRRTCVRSRTIAIEPAHAALLAMLSPVLGGRPPGLTEQNLQSRVRGTVLMALSNETGALLLGTSNKSELATGYGTLYGDMVGGLGVLGDCYKAWVREIAELVDDGAAAGEEPVPRAIVERAPTAELMEGQRDEDDLPPYALLDPILEGLIERRLSRAALVAEGMPPEMVREVRRRLDGAEFKRRQAPPSLRVTPRAFGPGRRLPIARG